MNVVVPYRLLISTVKTMRLTGCLVALLACSQFVQAQAVDSVLEEIAAPPVEEGKTGPSEKVSFPDPLEIRTVPDSTVRRYQKEDDFAYANDPDYWNNEREQALKRKREQEERERLQEQDSQTRSYKKGFWDHFNDFFSGKVIRNITYFVLIGFFLFIIYRIAVVNKLFLFYSSKKVKTAAGGEEVDIEDDNLDERIRKAVAAKEYRMAVRYMYLKTLQLLNERQWIRYQADATNYEYVTQMGQHKLGNDFGFLTRIYDYVWYGEFILTDEQFELVHKNFSHFYNALH